MDDDGGSKKTRKLRKRKALSKESSPETDDDSLLNWKDEEMEEKTPRKRGRKGREKEKDSAMNENNDVYSTMSEIEQVYNIVKQFKSSALAQPFMYRPNEKLDGMSDYYETITSPMWLTAIDKKYEEGAYSTATDIASDVRMMFENCYYYWGPNDVLTKKGIKLEQRFEQKLLSLPEETQKLCSLVMTHGEEILECEEPESLQKKGSSSRLLQWVISGKGRFSKDRLVNETKTETLLNEIENEEEERQLVLWESKHLLIDDVVEQISSMPEFPEIGLFLHLVYNVLNVEPLSHTELERMFLMPQASSSLSKVVTSMLIPPFARQKLEVGPTMPYSIWSKRLNNKVINWYKLYQNKCYNAMEVFQSMGISPQFWLVMGDENPLRDSQFHELSLLRRVWLVKGLCDYIMHNHKSIKECISNMDQEEQREMNIGKDRDGFSYHYFPMFNEVRVYRMKEIPNSKWNIYNSGVDIAMTMMAKQEENEEEEDNNNTNGFTERFLRKTPKCIKQDYHDFKMVADSVEGLRNLLEEISDSNPHGNDATLVTNLNSIITQLEPIENKIVASAYTIRKKMRDEWTEYKNRGADYVDPGIAFWSVLGEKSEKGDTSSEEKRRESTESIDSTLMDLPPGPSDPEKRDCRERRSKRESQLKIMASIEHQNDDSDSEEELDEFFDDDSSEEWHIPGSKKKNKESKPKKVKKTDSPDKDDKIKNSVQIKKETDSSTKTSKKSSKKPSVNGLPVPIKTEIPDSEMDSKLNIVSKLGTSVSVTGKKNASPAQSNANIIQTLVPFVKDPTSKVDLSKIKKSGSPEPEDVVYISDTEEPDIKPTPAQLMKARGNKSPYTNNVSHTRNQPSNTSTVFTVKPSTFSQQQNTIQTHQINYTMPNQAINQPNPILGPQQTMLQIQNPIGVQQKYVVIQQPQSGSSANQQMFISKQGVVQTGNTTVQPVNWYGPRTASPVNATPQSPVRMASPRHRGQPFTVQARSPQQTMRGRGVLRSPNTPVRMPRFSARTPNQSPNVNIRTPKSGAMGVRTPIMGSRTPSMGVRTPLGVSTPTLGQRTPGSVIRSPAAARGRPVVRNLNFSQTPPKLNQAAPCGPPDIEGELTIRETDNGGFGFVVVLADGGVISLTSEQLAQIRSENGGVLPKKCKVPIKQPKKTF